MPLKTKKQSGIDYVSDLGPTSLGLPDMATCQSAARTLAVLAERNGARDELPELLEMLGLKK